MKRDDTVGETLDIFAGTDSYNRWIFSHLEDHLGGRVLEIGCGIGNISLLLMDRELVVGTDVDPCFIAEAERRLAGRGNFHAYLHDIAEGPVPGYPDCFFDSAICINVLEHIEDERAAVRNMVRQLKPGGRLLLYLPAGPFAYNSIDRNVGHFRRYDRRAAEKLLRDAGLRIIEDRYVNLIGILGWYFYGLLRPRMLPKGGVRIVDRMTPFLSRIEAVLPPPIGLSLIIVGEKVVDES